MGDEETFSVAVQIGLVTLAPKVSVQVVELLIAQLPAFTGVPVPPVLFRSNAS
jgi:hypothetical protein